MAEKNPDLDIYQAGSLDPYMVINFQSPNQGHATSKLDVRQAIEYAVDKAGVIQVNGGTLLNAPQNQVITPGSVGYNPFDLYPSTDSRGNPQKAKQLLAAAGYPKGLTLKLYYDEDDPDPQIAEVVQASLAQAGITVALHQVPVDNLYGNYLATPSEAKQGVWDLALVVWGPDWFGNNGRTTIQPLLDGATWPGSSDYGDYNTVRENQLINQALAAPTSTAAAKLWARPIAKPWPTLPSCPSTCTSTPFSIPPTSTTGTSTPIPGSATSPTCGYRVPEARGLNPSAPPPEGRGCGCPAPGQATRVHPSSSAPRWPEGAVVHDSRTLGSSTT